MRLVFKNYSVEIEGFILYEELDSWESYKIIKIKSILEKLGLQSIPLEKINSLGVEVQEFTKSKRMEFVEIRFENLSFGPRIWIMTSIINEKDFLRLCKEFQKTVNFIKFLSERTKRELQKQISFEVRL